MVFSRKRDLSDEAASFAEVLVDFFTTLAALIRSAATWFGIAGLDAVSRGADAVSRQAGELGTASRARVKSARRAGRRALVKLALVAVFLWWLDRDLSER